MTELDKRVKLLCDIYNLTEPSGKSEIERIANFTKDLEKLDRPSVLFKFKSMVKVYYTGEEKEEIVRYLDKLFNKKTLNITIKSNKRYGEINK